MRWILRSKIHKATVTEANIDYIGSIVIDEELVKKVGLRIFEYPLFFLFKILNKSFSLLTDR